MHAFHRHRPERSYAHYRHRAPELPPESPTPRSGALTTILLWVAAAVLLFEEWFWASSTRAIATLARKFHLSPVGDWIRARPPAQAQALFILPVLTIYPFKVLALVALAQGDVVLGGAAFVGAKLVATAIFARLYELTEPALLHFRWIRIAKAKFLQARAFIHAWLDARPAYRRARAKIRHRQAHLAYRYRVAHRLLGRRRRARMQARANRIEPSADTREGANAHGRGARRR